MIIEDLRALDPDVVALQESPVTRRRGDVAARIAQALGLAHVHARATERVFPLRLLGRLIVGALGFVSRFPITASEVHDLPRAALARSPGGAAGRRRRRPACSGLLDPHLARRLKKQSAAEAPRGEEGQCEAPRSPRAAPERRPTTARPGSQASTTAGRPIKSGRLGAVPLPAPVGSTPGPEDAASLTSDPRGQVAGGFSPVTL